MAPTTQQIIASQNDRFRRGDPALPGRIVMTSGIRNLLDEVGKDVNSVINVVQAFDTFTEDNDPYGEHDFGKFNFEGRSCFWKIDLYDVNYTYGSEAPADPEMTRRVLTIMLASEY